MSTSQYGMSSFFAALQMRINLFFISTSFHSKEKSSDSPKRNPRDTQKITTLITCSGTTDKSASVAVGVGGAIRTCTQGGGVVMEKSTQDWLNRHLKHAKTKRPGFASSVEEKRTILTEEFEEVMEALDRGGIDHPIYELRG